MERKGRPSGAGVEAHLALNVENVERSTVFLQETGGMSPSRCRRLRKLRTNRRSMTLNERPNVRAAQSRTWEQVSRQKLCWQCARIAEKGLLRLMKCRPIVLALQDKTWVSDPDGNEWEVFVVLQDNLPQTSSCCVPSAETKVEAEAATTASCATETTAAAATTSCCGAAANAPVELAR